MEQDNGDVWRPEDCEGCLLSEGRSECCLGDPDALRLAYDVLCVFFADKPRRVPRKPRKPRVRRRGRVEPGHDDG